MQTPGVAPPSCVVTPFPTPFSTTHHLPEDLDLRVAVVQARKRLTHAKRVTRITLRPVWIRQVRLVDAAPEDDERVLL